VADDESLSEYGEAEREGRGRKRRALRREEDDQERRGLGRRRRADGAGAEPDGVDASPVQRLQRRYGNAALLQLRSSWGAGGAPGWIKEELGVTAETEEDARRAKALTEAAETAEIPSGGSPLAREVREPVERRLGVSLSDVNVVERGDSATKPLEAEAFAAADTAGRHSVVLSSGVDLGSPEGQFTLAHELAHVAQQKKGEADSLEGLGGDESVRNRLEQNADEDAKRLLGGSS
jgi:hypothetical protein